MCGRVFAYGLQLVFKTNTMITIAGQIESISTRKDKTLKVTIGTQELSPSETGAVFNLNQDFCYFGIKQEPFTKDEEDTIDNLKTDYENLKTPSQRLRGILYVLYNQDNKGYKDFTTYYVAEMDRICEHFKSRLNG